MLKSLFKLVALCKVDITMNVNNERYDKVDMDILLYLISGRSY